MPGCGTSDSPATKSRNVSLAVKMPIGIGNSGADIIRSSTASIFAAGFKCPDRMRALDQRVAERAQPRAAVEDQHMLAAAHLDAGGVSAIAHRVGAGTGNAAADTPKLHGKFGLGQNRSLAGPRPATIAPARIKTPYRPPRRGSDR